MDWLDATKLDHALGVFSTVRTTIKNEDMVIVIDHALKDVLSVLTKLGNELIEQEAE